MSILRKLLLTRSTALHKRVAALFSTTPTPTRNIDDGNKNILHSGIPDVDIPQLPIVEFIFSKIDQWSSHIATECSVSGRQYSFDAIRTGVTYLSRALRKKLKLKKGDVLALLLPNCPQYGLAALGALDAGLVVTTLNPIYTPDEISKQLLDSDTKALIVFAEFAALAKKSVALTRRKIPILTVKTRVDEPTPEGTFNFDEFLEKIDYPDAPSPSIDDLAFLPYSSGTTGLPKGVQLTHKNVVSGICQFTSENVNVMKETEGNHQDVQPAVLPKFHIYGLVITTLVPIYIGAKTVSIPKFSPELYLSALRQYKPHVLFLAPPLVNFLASHPSVKSEDLQSLRTVVSGAAPLGALDEERFLQKAQKDISLIQGYGLTESSSIATIMRQDLKNLPNFNGSVGRPIPNTQVKIVDVNDPSHAPLGPNQTGEIFVKGPQIMKGYHNRPDQNKDSITSDGWFRTGDIGSYNEDGLLFVTDRMKELIKVKGFQVAPAELEEVIRDFPGVADVAVVGISHETQGEVPRAYVVAKSHQKIDCNKLNDYMKEKMAPYKQLKGGIEVVESIPKTAAGKILRRQLKLQYEEAKKK